jgi:hypothetical protein
MDRDKLLRALVKPLYDVPELQAACVEQVGAALDLDKIEDLVEAGKDMVQAARTNDYALANKAIVALRAALAALGEREEG